LSSRLKERQSPLPVRRVPETNEKTVLGFFQQNGLRPRQSQRVDAGDLRHPVSMAPPRRDASPRIAMGQTRSPTDPAPAAAPAVVRAPEVVGIVLTTNSPDRSELFKGRSETVPIELDGRRLRLKAT